MVVKEERHNMKGQSYDGEYSSEDNDEFLKGLGFKDPFH